MRTNIATTAKSSTAAASTIHACDIVWVIDDSRHIVQAEVIKVESVETGVRSITDPHHVALTTAVTYRIKGIGIRKQGEAFLTKEELLASL